VSAATAPFAFEIPLPVSREVGIGIIGAGMIVTNSHLPAYAEAGFSVVAIADRDKAKAERLAARFAIPRVYGSATELLADPVVEVVDLALPPQNQPPVAIEAIAAGKHLQCHKPLAMRFEDALEIVHAATVAGVKLAVNQNSRWIPGVRATGNLLREGALGEPTGAAFDLGWANEWDAMDASGWLDTADITLRTDCVHHLDTCRFWFGEPESVLATSWRSPAQRPSGDTRVLVALRYSDSLCATIRSNGDEPIGEAWARYRVEGTEGITTGTFAQYSHYGLPVPDEFEAVFLNQPGCVFRPSFPYTVVPHAFMATMAQLLLAVETDGEAESSGQDNLKTMRLIEAAAKSISERRAVAPSEIATLDGEVRG
jgi:predicted dehydrogenase